MAALYPEDFQGAESSRDDIVIISSDEDELMDNLSLTSVFDLQLSSEGEEEDEEIILMAKCVEMEMSAPIPIPGPSYAVRARQEVVPPGLPKYGMQTRPRDDRLRDGHPITLCRNLVPMVDTPLPPPPQERGPTYDIRPTVYCDAHGYQHQRPDQSLESITKHL